MSLLRYVMIGEIQLYNILKSTDLRKIQKTKNADCVATH